MTLRSWHLVLRGSSSPRIEPGSFYTEEPLLSEPPGSLEPGARLINVSVLLQARPCLKYPSQNGVPPHCIISDKFKFPLFHTDTFLVKLGHQFYTFVASKRYRLSTRLDTNDTIRRAQMKQVPATCSSQQSHPAL